MSHACGFRVTREWTRMDRQVAHERHCTFTSLVAWVTVVKLMHMCYGLASPLRWECMHSHVVRGRSDISGAAQSEWVCDLQTQWKWNKNGRTDKHCCWPRSQAFLSFCGFQGLGTSHSLCRLALKRERSVSTLLLNRVCHCYTGYIAPGPLDCIVWKPFQCIDAKNSCE